jgi:uncharacterized protein (TIGR00266 family)
VQVETRHSPSFAVARVHLAPGESVRAESGAMAMTSLGVQIAAQMQGGLLGSLKRSVLGGESLFVTTFTGHPQAPSWVDLAARLPGDVVSFDVTPGRGIVFTRGSWLANDVGVEMDTKWGGARMLFGGEGGFVLHMSGLGTVLGACYGALDRHDLGAGQGFTVDSGHLVAYEETVQIQSRAAAPGLMQSWKSGEGLVLDVHGPGTVWTQTRSPAEFVRWLTSSLPGQRG